MDQFVITIHSDNEYTNVSKKTTIFGTLIQQIQTNISSIEEKYEKMFREKLVLPIATNNKERCLDFDFEMTDLSNKKLKKETDQKEPTIVPINDDDNFNKTSTTDTDQIVTADLYCDMV